MTPPSIAGDKMYLGTTRGEVLCVDVSNGNVLWSYSASGINSPVRFQPSIMNGRIFFGTDSGTVYCIDAGDATATGWAMWGGNAQHNGWTK
jgi:outer membrane protein assembly factor BamB